SSLSNGAMSETSPPRTYLLSLLLLSYASLSYESSAQLQNTGCSGGEFSGDNTNPCIYYQCVHGGMVQKRCAPGTGVVRGFRGSSNPCVERNDQCKGTTNSQTSGSQNTGYGRQQNNARQNSVYQNSQNMVNNNMGYGQSSGKYQQRSNTNQMGSQQSYSQNRIQSQRNSYQQMQPMQRQTHSYPPAVHSQPPSPVQKPSLPPAPIVMKVYVPTPVHVPGPIQVHQKTVKVAVPVPVPFPVPVPVPVPATPAPGTPAPDGLPFGFVFMAMNTHILGGTRFGAIGQYNRTECIEACRMEPTCLAVDYNLVDSSCWFHTQATACNDLVPKADCKHYKKINCASVTAAPITAAPVTQAPVPTTAIPTQAPITQAPITQAPITQAPVTQAPVTQAPITPMPPTGNRPAPVGMFMPGNLPGPTMIPASALAYPATQIMNGEFRFAGMTVEACFDACYNDVTCLGTDWNSNDGSCWIHREDTICLALEENKAVYHIKKMMCPSPYPAPL
ncbi:unnamed protein product, partial [Owenia fusiformis]